MRGELSARDVPEGCHRVSPLLRVRSHGLQYPPEAPAGPFGAAASVRRGGVRKARAYGFNEVFRVQAIRVGASTNFDTVGCIFLIKQINS